MLLLLLFVLQRFLTLLRVLLLLMELTKKSNSFSLRCGQLASCPKKNCRLFPQAFIVTWTPYSVLVVISALLGKDAADRYIPSVLWDFSYYLCYINSTVNPVLYALCNAAFRRTYIRILTCRWKSKARQPVNRYYYG